MAGWVGKAISAVKGSNKAIIKKGSSVSTDKIPDGRVEFVEPRSKKVTVQSKDGKMRETIKSKGVRVKSGAQTTNPDNLYADRDEPFKTISDFSENEILAMRPGQIVNHLVNSDLSSYSDLVKAAPGNSAAMRRVRNIGQDKVPGLRKTPEERAYKQNIFTREKELVAKELADKEKVDDLVARRRDFAKRGEEAYEKKHTSKPVGTDPEFANDRAKLIRAFQKWQDTGRWKKGGSVNVKKKKKYREVTNRFSDRMLPNKKRTTRIY